MTTMTIAYSIQHAMQNILTGMLKLESGAPASADSHFACAVKTLNHIAQGSMPYTDAFPLTEQTKELLEQLEYCLQIA